jgi:hypothetical protein
MKTEYIEDVDVRRAVPAACNVIYTKLINSTQSTYYIYSRSHFVTTPSTPSVLAVAAY